MLSPQHPQHTRIPVHRIIIQRPRPAREHGPKLPQHIRRHTRLLHDSLLPRPHDPHAVQPFPHRILLQHDGFVERLADGVVLRDPGGAPAGVVAPQVVVHVEGPVVERGDREVALEIHPVVPRVGVALVVVGDRARGSGREPAFVAERDHVVRVQGFDVGRGVRSPFGDDGGGAARADGLVAEFPAEDGGRGFVAVDDEFDVSFVGGLGLGVGVEAVVVAAVDVGVGVDAAQVVVVVEQGQDQLQAFLLRRGDGVVEASDAVGRVVVEVLAAGVEDLVVDIVLAIARVVGGAEAPDPEDLVASLWKAFSRGP